MFDERGQKVGTLTLSRTTTCGIFTTIELCDRSLLDRGSKYSSREFFANLYDFETLTRFTRPKYALVEGQSTLPGCILVRTLLTLHDSRVTMYHVT